jgi:hypothetical protein
MTGSALNKSSAKSSSFNVNKIFVYLLCLSLLGAVSVNVFEWYRDIVKYVVAILALLYGVWAMGTFKHRGVFAKTIPLRFVLLAIMPMIIFKTMRIDPNSIEGLFELVKLIGFSIFSGAMFAVMFWLVPLLLAIFAVSFVFSNTSVSGAVVTTYLDHESLTRAAKGDKIREQWSGKMLRYMWGQIVVNASLFSLLCLSSDGHIAYDLPFIGFIAIR